MKIQTLMGKSERALSSINKAACRTLLLSPPLNYNHTTFIWTKISKEDISKANNIVAATK